MRIADRVRHAAAAAVLVLVAAGCGRPEPPPNLVLVSFDTTRADHIGAWGRVGARTPTIDALAARGFAFRRHLTPVPVTLPAHTTMMTGRTPAEHTVRNNGTFRAPDAAVTLAEILRDAGWRTAAFVGAFPLDRRFGLDQGFEVYDDDVGARYRDADGYRLEPRQGIFFDERPARDVVDAALSHHRELDAEAPFFTFLHFFDPHQPLEPPPPFDVELRGRPYDAEIAAADHELGRFLAALEAAGRLERTIVIVTADHGEGLGEHNESTHAMLLHQATLHVPLVIAGPGVPAGAADVFTHHDQLLATALELLGVEPPDGLPVIGPSLAPLLAGGRPPARDLYFETVAPRLEQGWSQLAALQRDGRRYVHGPRPELYELERDPRELDDLAERQGGDASALRDALAGYLAERETLAVAAAMSDADDDTLRRLEALGYVVEGGTDGDPLVDMMDVAGRPNPRDMVIAVSMISNARAAMAAGMWVEARAMLEQLVAMNDGDADAHRMLATVYGVLRLWDRCFLHFERADALRPDDLRGRRFHGMVRIEAGEPERGLAILEALPDAAESREVCAWAGRAREAVGDVAAAERHYRRGLELEGSDRWMRLYLANLLAGSGRLGEARAEYEELLRQDPYFGLGLANFGRLLVASGELEAAREMLTRAVAALPGHAGTAALLHDVGRRLEGRDGTS